MSWEEYIGAKKKAWYDKKNPNVLRKSVVC